MLLQPGRHLGLFEVISPLGAGGMGEVYRARDTRLGRDVALKVLPAEFATRPDRRARFEREARLLASLQHPGIAAIHGFEEADGVSFLVLELVEGKTLAQRLDRGALAVPEALELAGQIALALEAAHEKGIVHRDLKPSNVMVMADGRVKLLDFGLAKAMEVEGAGGSELDTASDPASSSGLVLGTGPYMSPEQARGEPVDKRTDVWAFGCVVYEMLTGRRAFPGATSSEAVAAVLSREPDWAPLPSRLPDGIRRVLQRCLRKDPGRRLHDVADARLEIDEALGGPTGRVRSRQRVGPLATPVVLAVVSGAGLAIALRPSTNPRRPPMHFVVQADIASPLGAQSFVPFAISPTGKDLVYEGGSAGLRVRPIDHDGSRPLGQARGYDPFVSPDGQWVAYWWMGKLMKAPVSGASAPVALCSTENLVGGAWGSSGDIVFSPSEHGPLMTVSDRGGEPRPLTVLAPGELAHVWPQFLPGGKQLLYAAKTGSGRDDSLVVVADVASGMRALIIAGGSRPHYAPSGHLVYARWDSLFAAPFDPSRLVTTGPTEKVLDDVAVEPAGYTQFALGADGSLYYTRRVASRARRLVWVSRSGETQPLRVDPGHYWAPRLSPDERRIAVNVGPWPDSHLWIYDIATDSMRQLTRHFAAGAVWAPDSQRIAFAESAGGDAVARSIDLFTQSVGRDAPSELLLDEPAGLWPIAWSRDGASLAFYRVQVAIAKKEAPVGRVLLASRSVEAVPTASSGDAGLEGAALSPDQRWLASVSADSGDYQLYLQPFQRDGPRDQITSDGASHVVWSHDGREIFFARGNQMMAASVETRPTIHVGQPRILFRGDYESTEYGEGIADFDVSRDGQRFLMVELDPQERQATVIHVVLGWSDTLERRIAEGDRRGP